MAKGRKGLLIFAVVTGICCLPVWFFRQQWSLATQAFLLHDTQRVQQQHGTEHVDILNSKSQVRPYDIRQTVTESQFTVVMLTHNRTDIMLRTLGNFAQMEAVHKLVLQWNNAGIPVPNISEKLNFRGQLVVKVWTENLLRLRFQPIPEIETQGVFIVDDDFLFDERDINHAFNIWKNHSNVMVGFTPRGHAYKDGHYKYTFPPTAPASMVLTRAAFLHRDYLRMFSETLPSSIVHTIDSAVNCEDIAMNFVISDYCKCPGAINMNLRYKRQHLGESKGLWRRPGHFQQREKCLDEFAAAYTYMPLKEIVTIT